MEDFKEKKQIFKKSILDKKTKIYIAGHNGMVGSAVWRALVSKGYSNLIGKTSKEIDLMKSIKSTFDPKNILNPGKVL